MSAQRSRERDSSCPHVPDEQLRAIVCGGDAVALNDVASELAEWTLDAPPHNRLSASQIRSILDRLQRMTMFSRKELHLLRPPLAYAAGRDKTRKLKPLQQILDDAIRMVETDEMFENLKHFFEAIVAYHRYHGGKE